MCSFLILHILLLTSSLLGLISSLVFTNSLVLFRFFPSNLFLSRLVLPRITSFVSSCLALSRRLVLIHFVVLIFSLLLMRDLVLMSGVILMFRLILASRLLLFCAVLLFCNLLLGIVLS